MTRTFQRGFGIVTAAILSGLASACALHPPMGGGAGTAVVGASAETAAVATLNADAADDPAIWAAPPGQTVRLGGRRVDGFIAGTDKKAGLYLYAFDGAELQFLPEGLLNNVDLREVDGRVVLAASDRGRMGVAFYGFDPAADQTANAVRPIGFIKSDLAEPYGICMGSWGGALHTVLIGKDGAVRVYRVQLPANGASGTEVARFAVGSQSEGCVVDEQGGALYIGEEAKGLWRYPLADFSARILVEATGRGRLAADVEGVALLKDGSERFILVSSQGDSAFAVWRVDTPDPLYVGRFSVRAAGGVDAVTGTDGIDALGGRVGSAFPNGLVVVQDDVNDGQSQNFKLIDWRDVKSALAL